MRRIVGLALFIIALSCFSSDVWAYRFTWGCPRDMGCALFCDPVPCEFPNVINPCAVPCRPPTLQPQALPCAFDTACPSLKLPCHGVSYGDNPYPIFR